MSARELSLLFEADVDLALEAYGPAARIQATLANLHRDPEQRDEPYMPADFMPGAVVKTEEEKLLEFAEQIASGEIEECEPDPDEMARFRHAVTKIGNVVS
jgi:hypothetical protein